MGEAGQSELVRRIRDLREDLNWYYHRIELEQLEAAGSAGARIAQLQAQAHDRENELMRTLRELPASERENATLEAPADFSTEQLQASLPADAALVEYFASGDRLLAAARRLEFAAKWRFNRTVRALVASPAFVHGATFGARFVPALLRRLIVRAGDCAPVPGISSSQAEARPR